MAIYQLVSDIKRETVYQYCYGEPLSPVKSFFLKEWGLWGRSCPEFSSYVYIYYFQLQYRAGEDERSVPSCMSDVLFAVQLSCKKSLYKHLTGGWETLGDGGTWCSDVSRQTWLFSIKYLHGWEHPTVHSAD